VLSGPAIERLSESKIRKIIVTDTIDIPMEKHMDNMEIVTVGNVFGEAVKRIHNGESVSALFEF
jgi:ribose-phosphate pyrophosphokinase